MSVMDPDYWCVVAWDAKTENAWIILKSMDCALNEVLPESELSDNGCNSKWAKELITGIYHLKLRPWSYQTMPDGEWDNGIDVTQIKRLFELPSFEGAEV